MSDFAILNALERAEKHSPFLAKLIVKNPDIVEILKSGDIEKAQAASLSIDALDVGEKLRRQRSALALTIAIADLAGHWDLRKVTRALSDFADSALDQAITQAYAEYLPGKEVIGFAVIGLGKHGGRELNYSSDIDPIFLYDPKILPVDDCDDITKIAVRIGKRIIALLNDRNEFDYVFRVDMRLRPASEITPVALSVNAAIGHYESSALAWEQAAYIRARAAAGDKNLGQYFLDSIDTFVWRRSLDFGQIDNIRKMSHNIRDHYSKGQILGAGYDLKRGRGGIRECEFFIQVHQLIHGGRNASLRCRDTRDALALLVENGHVDEHDAHIIANAYNLLRTVEHRLQMVDDRQTHMLPETDDRVDNVAALHGLRSGAELLNLLQEPVRRVEAIYDKLVEDDAQIISLAEGGLPLIDQLEKMNFPSEEGARYIHLWRSGKYRALRSDTAKKSFEMILPDLLTSFAGAPDPIRALVRLDNILEKLPSAINFFHLLHERPAMLQLLGDILSYAPTLADALGRNAALLDGMIDSSEKMLNKAQYVDQMHAFFYADWDHQILLDAVRNFVAEKHFAIGVGLIEGALPSSAAAAYCALAEAAMQVLADSAVAEFRQAHGTIENSELLILALGRFGGGVLTHASDLDIVFLFTGDFSAQSNGKRPLGATQYYNRLSQRIIAALSAPTAAGALYEVDTRLRPSGNQGLLAVSVDSFTKYQRSNAWAWEHMALTRSRIVYRSGDVGNIDAQLQDDIADIVDHRDKPIYNEIAAMRSDMDIHKAAKTALDVKNAKGGLIDIEFIVHSLQLHHDLEIHANIEKAIVILSDSGLLPIEIFHAYDMMNKMLILLRLVCPDLLNITPATQQLMADNLGYDDWDALNQNLEQYRNIVKQEWQKIFAQMR